MKMENKTILNGMLWNRSNENISINNRANTMIEIGIIWPMEVAPYHVVVIPANSKNEEQMKVAEECLITKNYEANILLDDRNERAGVKFEDMNLMGVPMRITVGKKVSEGEVEFKLRSNSGRHSIEDVYNE